MGGVIRAKRDVDHESQENLVTISISVLIWKPPIYRKLNKNQNQTPRLIMATATVDRLIRPSAFFSLSLCHLGQISTAGSSQGVFASTCNEDVQPCKSSEQRQWLCRTCQDTTSP